MHIAGMRNGMARRGRKMGLCLLLTALGVLVYAVKVTSLQPPPTQTAPTPEPIVVEWHDAPAFTIEGKGWTATESPFDRFPAKAKGVVLETLWKLSRHSAGITVRFQSDASDLYFFWSLDHSGFGNTTMSEVGASGIDLYMRPPGGVWRHRSSGRPETKNGNLTKIGTGNSSKSIREFLLYLPTYNGITDLKIGVANSSKMYAAPDRPAEKSQPIVWYGTSIVQGVGSSRAGMAFTSILGRALDRPIINLGFSGSAYMEPETLQLLAELDPILFVIDTLKNAHNLPPAVLAARIEATARTLRLTHPVTPILFVGESSADPALLPRPASLLQEQVIQRLQKEGMQELYLFDGGRLYVKDSEGSVDDTHPNDYGMVSFARAMAPALQKLIAAHPTRNKPNIATVQPITK
ncbi:MAG: SGNH/GDSL hydrolase family protein [Armatimonadetes bacterium]|nr:SGNH/GDSL hydrolase family protein [Armatimonadota bacterium]